MRQEDVAREAGIGRWKIVVLEAAQIDELRVGELLRSFEALGARLDIVASYRGAELSRILDEVHPRLVQLILAILDSCGWQAKVEVSFSIGGERGSIDVLGWHPGTRSLLVVEVKSELPGVDPLLRPLDVKVRLAVRIARDQFGWDPATVSRVVVLPEDSTARRIARRHAVVLAAALPARSRAVRSWLRRPLGDLAGLWFLSVDRSFDTMRNPSSIRRVQRAHSVIGEREYGDDTWDSRLIDPHKVGLQDK